MNIIVNVDKNWGIGNKGGLIFPISEDLKRFKRLTTGKVVVMGRTTLESLPGGKPLKNRKNVVLSTTMRAAAPDEGLYVCPSLEEMQKLLASSAFAGHASADVFVIGGQSVYEKLLPLCDTAYITKVEVAAPQTDAFFPNLDEMRAWRVAERSELFTAPDGVPYRFVTYRREG